MQTEFWCGNTNGKNRSENLELNGKILKCVLKEIGLEDVDCIIVTSERDKWPPLANTVMKLRVR